MNVIDHLLTRRSVKAVAIAEPGPSPKDLETILKAGMRVPDHGKLTPWRFIVIKGAAREKFGNLLARIYAEETPEAREAQLKYNRELPLRAPVIVAVLNKRTPDHKIPLWEQELSAGAACQTMLIAALAMGYAAQWITEWPAYNAKVIEALGGSPDDRIAGFLYLGTKQEPPEERDRPDYDDIVSDWTGVA